MSRPIVVDLDGTLISSDMLVENLFLFIRNHPLRVFELLGWMVRGKAYLKSRLASEVMPAVESLPFNTGLLTWLRKQKANGATLVLATASDVRIARAIQEHLQLFDEVLGSTDGVNLSAHRKQSALVVRYGYKGYAYVGNSMDDRIVWQSASGVFLVNPELGVFRSVRAMGKVDEVFDNRPGYFRTILKALRVHQWAKNALIFVPLMASHNLLSWPLWFNGVLAFLAFGLCASSVYLLNDLLDLQDDRSHPTKRNRPLAAGTFPIFQAVMLIPLLLGLAFGLSLWMLPLPFSIALAGYYTLTMAYSLKLKRIVMLDVVVLAMLYALRVVAGAMAMSLEITFWILAFCIFIFLSLAFVKRYTELNTVRQSGGLDKPSGRGYYPADFELLSALGGGAGYISVLVLALYINEASFGELYRSPQWMWAACPLLLYWLSRVWLLAHRGEMHDDPVVFALRDKVSRWILVVFLAVFGLAAL